MIQVSHPATDFAIGLVPLPRAPKPIDDDRALLEIRLLRSKQLRRPDVRQKLFEYAEKRQEVAR